MTAATRKTQEELFTEAKSEYRVPVNLSLTIEQAELVARALTRGYLDLGYDQSVLDLANNLYHSINHGYDFCAGLARGRYIAQA